MDPLAHIRHHPSPMEPFTHFTHLRRDGADIVWTATGHERPVFLDEHGRRRRWVLAGGALAGGASAMWLTALVAGAIGFSTLPSVHAHSPLLAERTEVRDVASVKRRSRVSVVSARRPSTLERATGLAVSRALISAQ